MKLSNEIKVVKQNEYEISKIMKWNKRNKNEIKGNN